MINLLKMSSKMKPLSPQELEKFLRLRIEMLEKMIGQYQSRPYVVIEHKGQYYQSFKLENYNET